MRECDRGVAEGAWCWAAVRRDALPGSLLSRLHLLSCSCWWTSAC
jgi:hypothetical protein